MFWSQGGTHLEIHLLHMYFIYHDGADVAGQLAMALGPGGQQRAWGLDHLQAPRVQPETRWIAHACSVEHWWYIHKLVSFQLDTWLQVLLVYLCGFSGVTQESIKCVKLQKIWEMDN
jgi:hypothetical protein